MPSALRLRVGTRMRAASRRCRTIQALSLKRDLPFQHKAFVWPSLATDDVNTLAGLNSPRRSSCARRPPTPGRVSLARFFFTRVVLWAGSSENERMLKDGRGTEAVLGTSSPAYVAVWLAIRHPFPKA